MATSRQATVVQSGRAAVVTFGRAAMVQSRQAAGHTVSEQQRLLRWHFPESGPQPPVVHETILRVVRAQVKQRRTRATSFSVDHTGGLRRQGLLCASLALVDPLSTEAPPPAGGRVWVRRNRSSAFPVDVFLLLPSICRTGYAFPVYENDIMLPLQIHALLKVKKRVVTFAQYRVTHGTSRTHTRRRDRGDPRPRSNQVAEEPVVPQSTLGRQAGRRQAQPRALGRALSWEHRGSPILRRTQIAGQAAQSLQTDLGGPGARGVAGSGQDAQGCTAEWVWKRPRSLVPGKAGPAEDAPRLRQR